MPIGMNAIAEGWFGSGSGGSSESESGGSAPSEESGLFDWGAAAPTQPPAEQAFALQAVVPGDTLLMRVVRTAPIRHNILSIKGYAFVADKLVAESEFMVQIVKREN